jgi:hypothetical protein
MTYLILQFVLPFWAMPSPRFEADDGLDVMPPEAIFLTAPPLR